MEKGEIYNDLTVIKYLRNDKKGFQWWLFKCICGKTREIRSLHVRRNHTKSCGCRTVRVATTHNMSYDRFYSVWRSMVKRCFNKRHDNNIYRDRGIKPIKRWLKFENFRDDMYKSYLEFAKINGEKNTTLDRINNNKGYTKNNIRWATYKEQANNRRDNNLITFNGVTRTLTQWADSLGMSQAGMFDRIYKLKWSTEKALTTPRRSYGHEREK